MNLIHLRVRKNFACFVLGVVLIALGQPASVFAAAFKYKDVPGDMKWPNGRVFYTFKSDVIASEREEFERAARAWQKVANINFVLTYESNETLHQSPAGNYLLVQRNYIGRDVNFAFIGRCGSFTIPFTGMQPLSINAWHAQSVIVHEIGHVLGLVHEQQRTDRDDFVQLDWTNINLATAINWDKESKSVRATDYDFDSIMHYSNESYRYPWSTGDTMRAITDPSKTLTMGRFWLEETQDYSGYLSEFDIAGISGEYGHPAKFHGVAVTANNYAVEGATVTLLAASGSDEANVIRLMSRTGENITTTGQDGNFEFTGLPTGNYSVRVEKAGYTFSPAEISFYTGTQGETITGLFTAVESTPPTVTINVPARAPDNHYRQVFSVGGEAKDTGGSAAGVKEVLVALSNNSGQWWNWTATTPGFDSTTFNWDHHAKAANFSGTQWVQSENWPTLPEGNYHLHVRGKDFSDNVSPWNSGPFVNDTTAPNIWSNFGSGPFFDFETAGISGWVSDILDNSPTVTFRIKSISTNLYWNGSGWGTTAFDLPTQIDSGSWKPAPGLALPQRNAITEGTYEITVKAKDHASNTITLPPVSLNRTITDETVPDIVIESPPSDITYAERAMPTISGTVYDYESYIRGIRLYLMHFQPNGSFRYWNGESWVDGAAYLDVQLATEHGNGTWTAPGPGYQLPTGEDLPDGTYKLQAAAFNRESPQGTRLVESTFYIGIAPPQVTVSSPTHHGFSKLGWEISGTTVDPSGTGFTNNRVTLSIYRDGQFWNGNQWASGGGSPIELHATILPDGTWTYPGDSGDTLPPGEGEYTVSVSVTDNNGLSSVPVAGGYSGNNQITFRVDTTPPDCEISTPAEGTQLTTTGMSVTFTGTASDSYPAQPPVTLLIKRNDDGAYWDGKHWYSDAATTSGILATYDSNHGWGTSKPMPMAGWDHTHNMVNGSYTFIAIARDSAGNTTQRERVVTVALAQNYPSDSLGVSQTPPISEDAISQTEMFRYPPLPEDDDRTQNPTFLRVTNSNEIITGVNLSKSSGSYYNTVHYPSTSILKHAASGTELWKKERQLNSVTQTINNETTTTYYERWGPNDPWVTIPGVDYTPYTTLSAMEVDAAGNVYAGFDLAYLKYVQYAISSSGSPLYHYAPVRGNITVIAKFDANGNLVWRSHVANVYERNSLQSLKPLADGSVVALITNSWHYSSNYYPYHSNSGSQTVVAQCGSPSGNFKAEFGYSLTSPYNSSPVDIAVDAAGNVLVASAESDPSDLDHYIFHRIRQISPSGTLTKKITVPYGESPETWKRMMMDPANGDLYISGTARVFSSGTVNLSLLKFDLDRAAGSELVWRRFGPAGRAGNGDAFLTLSDHTVTVADTAYESGDFNSNYFVSVATFAKSGELLWTRKVDDEALKYTPTWGTGGGLSALNMSADAAGNVYLICSGRREGVVKLAANGDMQFVKPFPDGLSSSVNYSMRDGHLRFLADHSIAVAVRSWSFSDQQPLILKISNPANVAVPLNIGSDNPADQFAPVGSTVTLEVINTGSPATYQWQKDDANGVPQSIPGATGPTLTLANAAQTDSGQYRVILTSTVNTSESLSSRKASVSIYSVVSLPEALDTPGLVWQTSSPDSWIGQTAISSDGFDAAVNAPLASYASSWMETTVAGPGTLGFHWKRPPSGGSLDLYIDPVGDSDGSLLLSGYSTSFTQESVQIPAGTHTVRFKATAGYFANQLGFVDRVAFVRGSQAPAVTIDAPEGSLAYSLNEVRGSATDTIETVSYSIRRLDDGHYWTGTEWVASPTELATNLNPIAGTWASSVELPEGDALEDGDYQFIAYGRNSTGAEVSAQTIITLSPNISLGVSLDSPTSGADLNYLSFAGGSASPRATSVTLKIIKLSDQTFWDGSQWSTEPIELATNFYAAGGDWFYQNLPEFEPGDYQFIATATDADNQTATASATASATLTTGPQITSLLISPASADVTTSAQSLDVTITTDRPVNFGLVTLTAPGGRSISGYFSPYDLQGSSYQMTLDLPRHLESGSWTVSAYVQDSEYRSMFYSSDSRPLPDGSTTAVQIVNTGATDLTAPVVTSLTMTPSPATVTSAPQEITVTLDVTDDIGLSNGYFTLASPDRSQSLYGSISAQTRISGTAANGTYRFMVTVPAHAQPGDWTASLYLTDISQRSSDYDAASSPSFPSGIDGTLPVVNTGGVDSAGPVLKSLTLSAGSTDVSSSAQIITAILRVTDDLAGLDEGAVQLESPGGTQYLSAPFSAAQRTSGTAADGTYTVPITIPQFAAPGVWTLRVGVSDFSGKYEGYSTKVYDSPFPAGATTQLQIQNTGPVDATAPQLTGLSFSKSTVNVATTAQSVTIQMQLSDAEGGVAGGYVGFWKDGTEVVTDFDTSAGAGGSYNVTVTIPHGAAEGAWAFGLAVRDHFGNWRDYGAASTYHPEPLPAGAPSVLNVTTTTQAPFEQWSQSQFPAGTPAASMLSDADPDKDGVPNLLEYAFNTPPTSAVGRDQLPAMAIQRDSQSKPTHLVMTYNERSGSSDLAYKIPVSSDMQTWDTTGATVERVSTTPNPDGVTQRVTVRVPTGTGKRKFMRVLVERATP